jgi:hypothetical protein
MTQTQHQQVSLHIDTLADQTLALYRQHQQRERQCGEDRMRQQDQQAMAVFKLLLETEVETDLLAALSVTYEAHHEHNDIPQIAAVFSYAGVEWHLSQEWQRQPGEWRWAIHPTQHGYGSRSSLYDLSTIASPQALRTTLFLKLGERREQLLREEHEATERKRKQQQAEEETHAMQEREAQKRALRRAQAVQEHRSWSEQLDALKQGALQRLWRWPEELCISLYHVSYCAGIGRGEDDEPVLEHAGGWTGTDHLDEHGYLRLEPAKPSSWSKATAPRTIKLSPAIHLPIWERWTVGSVDELPSELREEVIVSLPGVVARRDEDLDAGFRLTRDEQAYSEDYFQECIGRVPLAWVRTLVDQAAGEQEGASHA